ncbi:MAG: 2'-5' RNA ligase family protein [Acidimicrobiales bacterium]|nr:2'-5' RNA ligase family protein [Acidimicrobiales bacterium]
MDERQGGQPHGGGEPAPGSGNAIRTFVRSHRVLGTPARRLSRIVASSSKSSPVATLLGPLRDRLQGAMKVENVRRVLRALETHGVPFHLAGGWAVDALEGWETRTHDGLTVVIDDFERDGERSAHALASLGFHVTARPQGDRWMPRLLVLADSAGRRVELACLDVPSVARELRAPGAETDMRVSTEAGVYAEGTIEGRPVPCLSAVVLLLHHTRFELGPSQRESGLFLPVPSAERHVGVLRQRFDPGSMPAHVTILYPFVAPESITGAVVDDLSDLLGSVEPFEFSLGEIRWFDDRVMYLAPDPSAAFVDLTTRISARFPGHAPYRGAFGEVVPHLTVGDGGRPARMRRAGARLQRHLPIRAQSTRLWLMTPDRSGRWALRLSFPLGRPLRWRI